MDLAIHRLKSCQSFAAVSDDKLGSLVMQERVFEPLQSDIEPETKKGKPKPKQQKVKQREHGVLTSANRIKAQDCKLAQINAFLDTMDQQADCMREEFDIQQAMITETNDQMQQEQNEQEEEIKECDEIIK